MSAETTDAQTLQQLADKIARMVHIREVSPEQAERVRFSDEALIRELDNVAARAGRMMARCRGNIQVRAEDFALQYAMALGAQVKREHEGLEP